jgi:flavodoxin
VSSSAPTAPRRGPRADAAGHTSPLWAVWFVAALLVAGCSERVTPRDLESAPETGAPTATDDARTVIVYLTRTGNTEAVARLIQSHVGGELVPLELEMPYPEDYEEIVRQVEEENESGFLPPLTTRMDLDSFDVVFLGFPTWGMQLPPPVKSFLHEHDLSGKTVVPFNTNAGYGVGSGFQTVRELAPDSRVLDGFSITGGVERDGVLFVMEGEKAQEADEQVQRWLRDLGFLS